MRRSLLALLLLSAGASLLGAQERGVTLTDAIRLSAQVQPLVVEAETEVRTANALRRSAWGAYLPTVTASSSASDFFSEGASRIDPVTGRLTTGNSSNRSISTSLSASLDLFTGFRRGAEMGAARASQYAADASLVDARFQQALETTNQFFDALAAEQLVVVRQASVRRAEEQLKVSVAKLRAGSATRSDSLRSLVTLGDARLELIGAETDLASAQAGLARLVGEIGRVRAVDDSAYYQVVTAVDTLTLRAEAESRSPRIQSASAGASAARASLRASRSAYWPSLTLSANTAWNGSGIDDYSLLNQRQVRLALNWTLFNQFDRELAVVQRSASLDVAEARADDSRRAVAAELTTRLAELDAARARIDITLTSVAAASEDIRVQQERYRLGASTIVDVLTSQEALNQAEVNVVVARFDYLRAKAQLETLIGRTL
ncbi:MAG: TolC family protein [Gemmatimonadales bacterium]|nr:TolC family protein [Gemmatimonadales bacterium]MDQ3428291.1 TolC family protein [Gemmatimonadota bacterium]